jgi:hypothetical protein
VITFTLLMLKSRIVKPFFEASRDVVYLAHVPVRCRVSDSEKFGLTEETPIEVELSAQDLWDLSVLPASEHQELRAEPQAAEQRPAEAVSVVEQPVPTRAAPSRNNRISVPRIALALTLAVAAVSVFGARYQYQPPIPERPASPPSNSLQSEPASFEKAPLATDSQRPPVLFRNPFDASEVFEFPPDTSRAEARAAVADLLVKRATERQQQTETRLSQRRSH